MQRDHLPEVERIERASFGIPWSYSMFLAELGHPYGWRRVVLDAESRVAGYIVCRFYGDLWHIMDLAVRDTCRGQGIGAFLMDEFLTQTAASRAPYTLEVRESNAAAMALYESRGFQVTGRRRGYYHDTNEDALVMQRAAKVDA